jgi:hypothetical protein
LNPAATHSFSAFANVHGPVVTRLGLYKTCAAFLAALRSVRVGRATVMLCQVIDQQEKIMALSNIFSLAKNFSDTQDHAHLANSKA